MLYFFGFLVLGFLRCLLCYKTIFRISFTRKIYKYVIVLIIFFSIYYLLFCFLDAPRILVDLLCVPVWLIWILSISEENRKQIAMVYPLILTLDAILSCLCEFTYAFICNEDFIGFPARYNYWCSFGCLIIYLVMFLIFNRTKNTFVDIKNLRLRDCIYYCFVYMAVIIVVSSIIKMFNCVNARDVRTMNLVGIGVTAAALILQVLIICYGIMIREKIDKERENAAYRMYIKEQRKVINEILRSEEELRKYRHELNHHIRIIEQIAADTSNSDLKDYCGNVLSEIKSIENVKYSGDVILDALFNRYKHIAEESGIQLEFNISAGINDRVDLFDLSGVLANLLQNAIEACQKCEKEAWIKLNMYRAENRVFIYMENSTVEEPVITDGIIMTTNADSENHGFGSANIKYVVEKYNGDVQYDCRNGVFSTKILM